MVAILAAVVMVVGNNIITQTIEERARSQLANDTAIVQLYIQQLEDEIIFLNRMLVSSQMLTEDLSTPYASRSLMITLINDLRHRGMHVRLHERRHPSEDPSFSVIQKGFLGIHTLELAVEHIGTGGVAELVSAAPVETRSGVVRVITVSFPLTSDYLETIAGRIGSEITLVLENNLAISSLPAEDARRLIALLRESGGLEEGIGKSWAQSTTSRAKTIQALASPFTINMETKGFLVLSMSMAHLLTARTDIFSRVLFSTFVLLSAASLLYLALIRRVTKPLSQLSAATRDVAEGNLDLQVNIATNDEVEDLAVSFNVMIRRLKESREEIEHWNQTLEGHVEERTRSLEAARSRLKATNDQLITTLRELKETQEKVIRSEKLAALGQMASTVAHEVRNPLAGMRGALQVLLREGSCGDRATVVELVIEQIDRLTETTNRLLSFTRQTTPRPIPTKITNVINQLRVLVEEQAEAHGVRIFVESDKIDYLLLLDPQLTLQAFLNIALNAVQAMTEGGMLTIASDWDRNARQLSITFEDTGEGIPREVLEKVFTPFFTTKHHGTGLGLYVTREIIEQQGGSIEVSSTPGVGTVFTVRLPASEDCPPSHTE